MQFLKAVLQQLCYSEAWQLQQNHTVFGVPFRMTGTQMHVVHFSAIVAWLGNDSAGDSKSESMNGALGLPSYAI